MAEHHHFRLKLPNGVEVDFGGDKDFVTEVYRDTKAAAVTLINRESARSGRGPVDSVLSGDMPPAPIDVVPNAPSLPAATPSTASPSPASADAGQAAAPAASGNSGQPPPKPKGDKKPSKPADPQKREAKAAREALIEKIITTLSFDQHIAYAAALKDAENPLDRAALVSRMAQDKFGIDAGLSPAEIRTILERRFSIGQDSRPLEQALADSETSFFVPTKSPFDGRAKVYRPVMGCIDRVKKLLEPHAGLDPAPQSENAQAASA